MIIIYISKRQNCNNIQTLMLFIAMEIDKWLTRIFYIF